MSRRATLPVDREAVRKADDQFYINHPGMVKDRRRLALERNNAAQWRLRQAWMDLYVRNGGNVEDPDANKRKPAEPVAPCPYAAGQTGSLAVRVIDDNDDSAISDATVSVDTIGEQPTDGGGVATFDCVTPGIYQIAATKAGYIPVPGYDQIEVQSDSTNSGTLRLQLVLEAKYSTEKSASYSSGAGPNDKVVYLTFDDGPWAGTQEVFDLLKALDVPATFFVVGENVKASLTEAPGLFEELYNHPSFQICNHSHTHAHQFYSDFYSAGLKLDKTTLEPDSATTAAVLRSVLMDFEYSSLAVTEALSSRKIRRPNDPSFSFRGTLDTTKLRAYSRFLSARLPGTNITRLPALSWSEGRTGAKTDEADDLVKNGYKIYGWDLEWHFDSNTLAAELRKEFNAHHSGRLDLYDAAHITLDRPTDSVDVVFNATKSKFDASVFGTPYKPNKILLLMHERMFRYAAAPSKNLYLDQLKEYIERCQKAGYKFDVVANY